MAELRHNDGTVRWRGDDAGEALAAIQALAQEVGDKAANYILIGFDSTELPSKTSKTATLISESAPKEWKVVNDQSGEVEQVWETKAKAEKAVQALRDTDRPTDTAPEFGETPKVEGRSVSFRVEE